MPNVERNGEQCFAGHGIDEQAGDHTHGRAGNVEVACRASQQGRDTNPRRLDAAAPTVEDHRLVISEDVRPALRLLAIGGIELREWLRRTAGRGHRHQAVIHRDDDLVVTAPVNALRQVDGRESAYAARGDVELPQHPQREKSQRLPIGREARLHR